MTAAASKPWLEGEFAEQVGSLKKVLLALTTDLRDADVPADSIDRLHEITTQLDELFLLVIVGEYNSGKSTTINALFGRRVCPEGPVPTTDRINVLKYGATPLERHLDDFIVERTVPYEPLQTLNIVDTPGTNSIVEKHQEITERYIPRADLVFFVTSVDGAYTQSEKQFLSLIHERWRKKIVFLLTKIDAQTPEAVEQVIAFIKTNCDTHFGFEPLVIPISPREAYAGRTEGNAERFAASNFQALEDYLFETLSDKERLTLKLTNPINAARAVVEDARQLLARRKATIAAHTETIARVDQLVTDRARAMKDGFTKHLLSIKNHLSNVESRGAQYFDDTIQLKHLMALRDRTRFRTEFEETVIRRFTEDLEEVLDRATDELVRSQMSLWGDALGEYNRWVDQAGEVSGAERLATNFDYNRDRIVQTIRQERQSALLAFDHRDHIAATHDNVAGGVNIVFGLWLLGAACLTIGLLIGSGGAIGAGAGGLVTFLAASVFVMPGRRRRAVQRFRARFQELHESLIHTLQSTIDEEVAALKAKLNERLDPARARFATMQARAERLDGALGDREVGLTEMETALLALIDRGFGGRAHGLAAPTAPATESAPPEEVQSGPDAADTAESAPSSDSGDPTPGTPDPSPEPAPSDEAATPDESPRSPEA